MEQQCSPRRDERMTYESKVEFAEGGDGKI